MPPLYSEQGLEQAKESFSSWPKRQLGRWPGTAAPSRGAQKETAMGLKPSLQGAAHCPTFTKIGGTDSQWPLRAASYAMMILEKTPASRHEELQSVLTWAGRTETHLTARSSSHRSDSASPHSLFLPLRPPASRRTPSQVASDARPHRYKKISAWIPKIHGP